MKQAWPMVPLEQLLSQSTEVLELEPDRQYRQVTLRLWGGGVVLRNEVAGATISAKKRRVARAGQFILSRIDARNGAFGLVPESLDGAVVSNDFPSFNINTGSLHPRFLEWMSKTETFVKLCRAASEGTTNRVRLQIGRFLATPIPLPPFDEQRRIVARIEELAALIEEAQELRAKARDEARELLDSALYEVFASAETEGWEHKLVKELCGKPQYGYTESAQLERVGPRFLRITDIQNGAVSWNTVPYCVCDDVDKYRLQPGDILFARTGATTGKSFLVKECPEAVFASYLIRLRLQSGVEPKYLCWFFQSPQYWDQVYEERKGSAQPNMNGRKLSNIVVPVAPSQEKRNRIVAYLDGLQVEVAQLTALQDATQAELDALLPSVLDRAFRGEL